MKCENYFLGLSSIFNISSTPEFKSHQILICHSKSTKEEIFSFISRSLKDPFGRLFCILGFEFVPLQISNAVFIYIQKQLKTYTLPSYLVFLYKTKKINWKNNIVVIKNFPIKKEISHFNFSDEVEVVSSQLPGMGKTFYIQNQIKSFELQKVNPRFSNKRLQFQFEFRGK